MALIKQALTLIHVTHTCIGGVEGGVLDVFDTEHVFSSSAMHVQCINVTQNASHSILMCI